MTRSYIEKVLRLNGISPEEAEDKISDLLKGMSWSDEKIKYALVLIKETEVPGEGDKKDNPAAKEAVSKNTTCFSNENYTAEKIRTMLNIELDASMYDPEANKNSRNTASLSQVLLIIFYVILASILTFAFVSWYYQIDVLAYL